MKKLLFIIAILFQSGLLHSQEADSLQTLIKSIQRGENDSIRSSANRIFLNGFEEMLKKPGSFEANMDSFENVSVITDGKSIRLYTWVMPGYSGELYTYYGFIQALTDSGITLFRLDDASGSISKPEKEKLSNENWLGAVYYAIVPVKKSRKIYFTLLGWKGNNEQKTQKLVDILYFEEGKPRFGYPLIKSGSVFKNRLIFTYPAQASMTLRYDSKFKGIVFDRIGVNKKTAEQEAGPTGAYDGMRYKRGRWQMQKDIDVRTNWKPISDVPFSEPEK